MDEEDKKTKKIWLISIKAMTIASLLNISVVLWLKGVRPFLQSDGSQILLLSSLFFLIGGLWVLIFTLKMSGINKKIQAAQIA